MRISAVFIVKNEEKLLEKALQTVKDFDEIIVVDTGSTDSTKEIASRYTDKIFDFPWIDDFSAARNFAIEKASGDWIYSIDADHELLSSVTKVKEEAQRAESLGIKTAKVVTYMGENDHHKHLRIVLFKNDPGVRWYGKVHEVVLPGTDFITEVVRRCGYSENHYKDPDRNLRILEASEKTPRVLFYLGREHYEKGHYDQAIQWMHEYLKIGTWDPERAEAWLVIARSHWFSQRGDAARAACLQAVKINPDFKEALLLMSELYFEPWKHKWERLASVATNQDVLFIRT